MEALDFDLYTRDRPIPEAAVDAIECLHRQLRPEMPQTYLAHLRAIFAEGGQLVVARQNSAVLALGLFRIFETTLGTKRLYVDDLVTDAAHRGASVGAQTLAWIEDHAARAGCGMATLESGVQRSAAHRFYIRTGYAITAFSFEKTLSPSEETPNGTV